MTGGNAPPAGIAHDDPWLLAYDGFEPAEEGLRETLCTTGNGYFATRGAAPEAESDGVHYPGTYVAGIFNRLASEVTGRTLVHESMVNAPNWLPLTFRIEDGPWFRLGDVELLSYRQELDLRRGVLTRRLRFRDVAGRHTRLTQRRFTSMDDPHLAALEATIAAEDWSGRLHVRSALDGDVANDGVARYRDLAARHLTAVDGAQVDEEAIELRACTSQSRIAIAEAARTRVFRPGKRVGAERRVTRGPRAIAMECACDVGAGDLIRIEKVVALSTSRDAATSEPGVQARRALERAGGFDELLQAHVAQWAHLWERMHLRIAGRPRQAFILNLHAFHLLQTLSPNSAELDVGVPARGLHGEGYRGHVFWDELFVFPSLTLRLPELARSLLRYRYRRLPEARRAALDAGHTGAMFPWQSGSDGREESQTWHLNPRSGHWRPDKSSRQRHVNIAVAYNVWHYFEATGDMEFMAFYGAELIFEIARFWASIAEYDHARGRYVVRGMMGPDEYHDGYPGRKEPGLDNNAYTNVMAVWVLCRAIELLDRLPLQRRAALSERLGLARAELDRWEDVSRRMFVPFHDGGIISQFEGYEALRELDWRGYRDRYGDIQRLDRILEAEGDSTNRYRASKQPDVLMLFFLLSSEQLAELFERLGYPFRYGTIPDAIEFYGRRTSHGSTLSRLVHSWVTARGDRRGSWQLFCETLESDVGDIQGGTTAEGIHLGAMTGTVDLVQRCYTGLDLRGDVLWLNPRLPDEMSALEFSIAYRGHWGIGIEIGGGRLRVTVPPSDTPPITIGYLGRLSQLGPGETLELRLQTPAARRASPTLGG